jgi:hypothetical protein
MNKKIVLLGMLVLFGFSSVQAQVTYLKPGPVKSTTYTAVAATALTSSVTTTWWNVGGYNRLTLDVVFTDADSSITRLDWICQTTNEDAPNTSLTNAYTIQTIYPTTSGIIIYNTMDARKSVSGSVKFPINIGVSNAKWVRCTFSAGAGTPGALDTIAIVPSVGEGC